MPFVDWPLEKLKAYQPEINKPENFDSFWNKSLQEIHSQPLNAVETPIPHPVKNIECFRFELDAYGGGKLVGYFLRPVKSEPVPLVVHLIGYTGDKGFPHSYLHWLSMGCAVCTVDTRDQFGESYSDRAFGRGHGVGWMTQGIESPETYYYRFVYGDCLRVLDFALGHEGIDNSRICVHGISQGGGLSLATASMDSRITHCMADIPFLCHFRRAIEISTELPYTEFVHFLKRFPALESKALNTLDYVDNLYLANRIKAKTLVSVGLQDMVCPPSTVFGVYNQISAQKEIKVYPYLAHEVSEFHLDLKIRWLAKEWSL